ncbi:MAG: MoxR family ATPase [Chlorobiaceae bacterium]|jgi:MoxR-like ATPase
MEHYNFYNNRAEENEGFEPDEQKTSPFKLSPDEQFPMIKREDQPAGTKGKGTITRGEEYDPSEELIHAVNVALMLHKPLLLTGEPGTGKSDLAYHLAWHFGWGDVEHFVTRTDSVATDLLYRYDSLAHFQKVNIQKECLPVSEIETMFISYVALGRAICDSSGDNVEGVAIRRVVLIDEIDKAPRDLPNDILTILEEMRFEVPQLKTADAKQKPIYKKTGKDELKPVVILTSNSEKTLPEAFLRRCVFFHIDMPKKKHLMKILLLKNSILPGITEPERDEFITLFYAIRDLVKGKKPATHELILWVWWMRKHGFTPGDIYHYDEHAAKAKILLSGISVLAKEADDCGTVTKAIVNHTLKG